MPGKSSGSVIGFKYYLGMHLVISKTVNQLVNVIINNRVLFGDNPVTQGLFTPSITTGGSPPNKDGKDIYLADTWRIVKDGFIFTTAVTEGQLITLNEQVMDSLSKSKINSVTDSILWNTPSTWVISNETIITTTQDLTIDKSELFGGDKREGGISGILGVKFGLPDQTKDAYLIRMFGEQFTPAFRGCFSLILKQMYIGVNPYLKNWEVLTQRTPCLGWYDEKAVIWSDDGYRDANPAHILRELLVNHNNNTSWGLNYPPLVIDDINFKAAADVLYTERFGLSFSWDVQETTENFIIKILSHINGVIRNNPNTGLLELKLIRKDHTFNGTAWVDSKGNNLIHLNEYNSDLTDYQSIGWGETINEVTVRYSQRWTGKAQSITVQDIANMQIQGQTIAQTQDLLGITYGDLAVRVAKMQLQVVSTPLSQIEIITNRIGFSLLKGDVVIVSWANKGLIQSFYRITEITKGQVKDSKIIIKAVLDVFSLPVTEVSLAIGNSPVPTYNPLSNPNAPTAKRVKVVEQTYWDLVFLRGGTFASSQDIGAAFIMGLMTSPREDTHEFALMLDIDQTAGENFILEASGVTCPSAILAVNLIQEIESTITFSDGIDMGLINNKFYGYIGEEIIQVKTIDLPNSTIVVSRGMLDTTPTKHTIGENIFIYGSFDAVTGKYSSNKYSAMGRTELLESTTPYQVRFLPRIPTDKLNINKAGNVPLVMQGRVTRPYPVGNLKINGLRYPTNVPFTGNLLISFSARDGMQITSSMALQSDALIGAYETFISYKLNVYYADSLKKTYTFSLINEINEVFNQLTNSNGVLTFTYTMEMQNVDLAGVSGYLPSSSLPDLFKIEIITVDTVSPLEEVESYQSNFAEFYRSL